MQLDVVFLLLNHQLFRHFSDGLFRLCDVLLEGFVHFGQLLSFTFQLCDSFF